jgi:hypothetical protein
VGCDRRCLHIELPGWLFLIHDADAAVLAALTEMLIAVVADRAAATRGALSPPSSREEN